MTAIRRVARPFAFAVLALFALPAAAPDCRGVAMDDGMPCCVKMADTSASFDAGCCNVRQPQPVPERSPAAMAAHSPDGTVQLAAVALPSSPSLARTHAIAPAHDVSPPAERLYIRLGSLRR